MSTVLALRTIIADIDLSDAGGNRCGGILLAEQLAEKNRRIPIILISHTPSYYFPSKDSPEFRKMREELCIHSILDRLEASFHEDLIKALR